MEEIKAGDLMINNWVEYDGKLYKISALSEEYQILNTDAFGVGVVTYRNIRGIPLTEYILFKCGFEELYKSKYTRKLEHRVYSFIEWIERPYQRCIYYDKQRISDIF